MAQKVCRPHVQRIVPAFGWNELRHYNCHRLIWLTLINNLFQVFEQRLNEEAERRIEDDKTCSLTPSSPPCVDLLCFLGFYRNMNRGHIIRKKFGIAQGF